MDPVLLQKLGFDLSSEWMFHDESFQKVFSVLDGITDENILTDQEILDYEEIKNKGLYLEDDALENELSNIIERYPDLFNVTDFNIELLEKENENLLKIKDTYDQKYQIEKFIPHVNAEIDNLKFTDIDLENQKRIIYDNCIEKANELQELQKQNKLLFDEAEDCYLKPHTPPLFIHQISFEPYFLRHNQFLFNLNQFIDKNFISKNDNENQFYDEEQAKYLERIEKCIKRLITYEIERLNAEIIIAGLQNLHESMNVDELNFINLEMIKEETNKLKFSYSDDEIISLTYELKELIKQSIEQKIEIILFDNTKDKLDRANKRLNNLKILSKTVSESLANAESLWILMQLDLEKFKNYFNYNEHLIHENNICVKNINNLLQLQQQQYDYKLLNINNCMKIISNILLEYNNGGKQQQQQQQNHQQNEIILSIEKIIEEYKIIKNSIKKGFNIITEKKSYQKIFNFIRDLEDEEKFLLPIIFNGPTSKLALEDYKYMGRIYNAKFEKDILEDKIQKVQSLIKSINCRMENDKLWKYYQCLWIWFLTEPQKVTLAIEDVRKEASKIPSVNIKVLSGIIRKN